MNGLTDVRLALHENDLRDSANASIQGLPSETGRWQRFWRKVATRRALLELEAHELRDIGLDMAQAREEGMKPFWR